MWEERLSPAGSWRVFSGCLLFRSHYRHVISVPLVYTQPLKESTSHAYLVQLFTNKTICSVFILVIHWSIIILKQMSWFCPIRQICRHCTALCKMNVTVGVVHFDLTTTNDTYTLLLNIWSTAITHKCINCYTQNNVTK